MKLILRPRRKDSPRVADARTRAAGNYQPKKLNRRGKWVPIPDTAGEERPPSWVHRHRRTRSVEDVRADVRAELENGDA